MGTGRPREPAGPRGVHVEAAVDHAFRSQDEDGASVTPVASIGRGGQEVRSTSHGYVQSVEWERLVALAADADRVVDMVVMPGDHVLEGDVLLRVGVREGVGERERVGASGPTTSGDGPDEEKLRSAVTLGPARTPVQDVGFALQQLVEIAVRGLASGTNDPYTAVSALDLSATALVPLWRERTAVTAYLDDEQVARVLPHWCSAEELIDSVFAGVRTYGSEHPLVVEAAERLVDRLGRDCSPVAPGAARADQGRPAGGRPAHLSAVRIRRSRRPRSAAGGR